MRKLIVNNFVTLDGYYEGKNKNIDSLFDYYTKTTPVIIALTSMPPNGCMQPIFCY